MSNQNFFLSTISETMLLKKTFCQRSAFIQFKNYRSRANTTRGLDFEHMIKARAHKEGVRIGKTPKN
jgi:hypothetical protein